jgi:hypothetical protein
MISVKLYQLKGYENSCPLVDEKVGLSTKRIIYVPISSAQYMTMLQQNSLGFLRIHRPHPHPPLFRHIRQTYYIYDTSAAIKQAYGNICGPE